MPKELFESESFGHVKGAFTGALRNRAGRFQLSDDCVLFLDPIGSSSQSVGGILTEGEMRERERANFLTALEQTNWRIPGIRGAGELLGIRPATLTSWMKKMGLQRPR